MARGPYEDNSFWKLIVDSKKAEDAKKAAEEEAARSSLYGLLNANPVSILNSKPSDVLFGGPPANPSLLSVLSGIPIPSQASPVITKPIATPPPPLGIQSCSRLVQGLLRRKPIVTPGRVLPEISEMARLQGRQIRAAFVYSDLHGFTKLVATQPEARSFLLLDTFVEIATRLTKHYNGEVMDVAGDRELSVFHRPLGDASDDPVHEAVTFALWLQGVFNKVICPAFGGSPGQLSLGIGVDYGQAIVGCVGIRNNKRIVFLGDPANDAAKLQDLAGPGETILSQEASRRRPTLLSNNGWTPKIELWKDQAIMRIHQYIDDENPPRP